MSLLMRTGSTKIDTLERIAEKLGVSPSVFFEDTPPAISTDHSIAVSGNKNKVNQAQEDKYIELLAKKDEQMLNNYLANRLIDVRATIAAALGHGGNTVTDIYISFDRRKIDEANRRVIDYVLYGKK